MLRLKGQVSKIDSSIFYWFDKEDLYGIISLHVDDFLWTRSNKFQKDIISRIRNIFEVGKEATSPFKYIGLNLSQKEMCIMLTPKNYIININIRFNPDCRRVTIQEYLTLVPGYS